MTGDAGPAGLGQAAHSTRHRDPVTDAIQSAQAHRNKYTGAVIGANQGFCPTCHLAFNSDAAYDMHRPRAYENGPCSDPAEIGMVSKIGKYGAVVWMTGRMPTDREYSR